MKRAILTGFDLFGGYKYNPVKDTAIEYNGKIIDNTEIMGLVLPCTYYGAFEILDKKIKEFSPNIILGTGLASRVPRIRIESIGRNIMNGIYADADGRKPQNELIVKDSKAFYSTNSDNIFLSNCLFNENIPSEISVDAEGFICNSLIYLTAKKITENNLPIKFAFFHTPWTEDYLDRIALEKGKATIKKEDLRKTIEVLITKLGEI